MSPEVSSRIFAVGNVSPFGLAGISLPRLVVIVVESAATPNRCVCVMTLSCRTSSNVLRRHSKRCTCRNAMREKNHRLKFLKYRPLQKLRGVMATISPFGRNSSAARAMNSM